jgi:hypothetical protein
VFNVEKYPTEYEIKHGNKTVRMVLQKDYAELRTAYFQLKDEFNYLQAKNDNV